MQFVATKELNCIRGYESLNVLRYNGLSIYYDNSFEKYSDSKKTVLLSGVIFNKDISEVTTNFNELEFGPVLIYIDHIKDKIYFLNDKFKIVTLLYTEGNKTVITNNWMFLNPRQFTFNDYKINLVKYNPRLHCIVYNGYDLTTKKVFSFDISHENDIDINKHSELIRSTIQSNVDKILKRYSNPLFMCSPKGVDSNLIAQCIENTGYAVQSYTRWGRKLTKDEMSFYTGVSNNPIISNVLDHTPEKNAHKNWSLNGAHAWHYFLDDFPENIDYDCILLGTNGDNAIPHTAEMAFSVDNYDKKEKDLVNLLKSMDLGRGLSPFHLRIIREWSNRYRNAYYFNDKGILGFIGYLQKNFNLLDCMYFVENVGYIQELGLQKNKPVITPFYDTRLYQILLKTKKEHLRQILNCDLLINSVLDNKRRNFIDSHRNQEEGMFETGVYNISNKFKFELLKIHKEMVDIDSPKIKDRLTGLHFNLAERESFELLLRYNFKKRYEEASIYSS